MSARIKAYELAFKMRMAVPELRDLRKESAATKALSAMDNAACGSRNCGRVPARARAMRREPREVSRLSARGLLNETLVIWGGEFGRTPTSDGNANGGGDNFGRDRISFHQRENG